MKNVILKNINKLHMRVTYLDYLRSRICSNKKRLNIGWCGPYPPAKNGGASVTAWFVKEMMSQNVDVFAIPMSNVCNKSLLKGIKFAKLTDRHLDAIFFYCADELFKKYSKSIKTKTIIYQLFHEDIFPGMKAIIENIAVADMVVAPTKWAHGYFESQGVFSYYVSHSVDTSVFKPMGKTTDKFEVLFVSRLCFYKGIKQFLLSIPFVLKECPDVIFRIHGVIDETDLVFPYLDGENKKIYTEVKTILKETLSRYSDNIKWDNQWHEWSDFNDAVSIYRNADILVFPSNNEGFGMPMIEAMSCGIPCIVADKPPMNEIIVNNETGYCLALSPEEEHKFRFPGSRDIAEKIIFLKNNPDVYNQMSKNARKRVQDEYELSKNTISMVNLVKKLIYNT